MATPVSAARETLATAIIRDLRARGHKAYLVGGCVRDRLLGIAPKDFDVGTDAIPEQVCRYFASSQLVGAHFGVVIVGTPDGIHVEVATFRSESAYSDGRRPDAVRFETNPELDARRRDFTINGLIQDPISGEVLDYVGGRADLEGRIVRAIGDPEQRFREDHLRMLRAVRLAARLQFAIAPETLAGIQRLAPAIIKTSPERIRDELIRILTEGGAQRGLELLDQTGLLPQILPEVKAFQGVQQPPEFHPEGDVWTHVLLMLEWMRAATPTLAFGVLLHDVGKPVTFRVADRIRFDGHAEIGTEMARQILSRLRFSNEDADRVESLVANHMRFKDVLQMRASTLKRFLRLPHFDEHLELHRLDCLASNGSTETYDFVRARLAELDEQELRPARLISGRDLIEAGYIPGPEFGRALEVIETAQLEGEIQTREQALDLARSVLDGVNG
ncbi:MAG: CCA tRNA nucleotidyltransferase [Acidobacteriaceae bacterium]|nr:CCA tRNA nucleotidyltransferase [Acidobacteriaceae bacterium]MBV9780223.1 CCA tRNA nucleotidyltransferase [Acidobacteriaceae bacterium]